MATDLDRIAREFSKTYTVIDDTNRRRRKGLKAAAVLKDRLQGKRICCVLDVGCSNSIFLDVVLDELKAIFGIGIDLDIASLPRPSQNRNAVVGNALVLPIRASSVDLVICNHTYEHVPDAVMLMEEIRRVLKADGIVYFAAMNSRWPLEPHYHLPFVHWLPKSWSLRIMRLFGHQFGYLEQPLDLYRLRELVRDFVIEDYTLKVLKRPRYYRAEDIVNPKLAWLIYPVSKLLYSWLPGYIWLLLKRAESTHHALNRS